jgi:glycosyltransferase involved in cell wall biosynthesis
LLAPVIRDAIISLAQVLPAAIGLKMMAFKTSKLSHESSSMTHPALSVIICTHNPRQDYLRRVLEALAVQTVPKDQWELVIVDNASAAALATEWDISWHPNARHVREERLGLAYARQLGVVEATADLLVFVDDDNVLAPNYLEEALRIAREWPCLGVWGGSMLPEFEVQPSSDIIVYLPLREVKSAVWGNLPNCAERMPWGAGMCLRAKVATAYVRDFNESPIRITGRSGQSTASGEDFEISYVARALGFGVGIFPNLTLIHLMPASRVTPAYVLRLIDGISFSMALLDFKWRGIMPPSPKKGLFLLHFLKNVLSRNGFHRRAYFAGQRASFRARKIIVGANVGPLLIDYKVWQ